MTPTTPSHNFVVSIFGDYLEVSWVVALVFRGVVTGHSARDCFEVFGYTPFSSSFHLPLASSTSYCHLRHK